MASYYLYGFNGLPAGLLWRREFQGIGLQTRCWTDLEASGEAAYRFKASYDYEYLNFLHTTP